ncbi:MAG TPA: permease prefix domain 1-containing protein [Verrucomicrobiae bacterium]|nr:permease prefix domain 1-containing protein [Verrucomicrobiae bacterium]
MPPPTPLGFDPGQAVIVWRKALLARESIPPDRVRELESHLRETMAGLVEDGLSNEEAFLVATRRMGTPETLAAEFEKEDPAAKWGQRTFWMAFGLLISQIWASLLAPVFKLLGDPRPGLSHAYLISVIAQTLSLAFAFFAFAKVSFSAFAAFVINRTYTRAHLVWLFTVLYLAPFIFPYLWNKLWNGAKSGPFLNAISVDLLTFTGFWPMLTIWLFLRYMPARRVSAKEPPCQTS